MLLVVVVDASPRIYPPLTPVKAAIKLQAVWRGLQARRLVLNLLRDRYEKHSDLEKERVYHVEKLASKKELPPKLWDPPPLLCKRYDLNDPVEIQRLARFATMTHDEAAPIYQEHLGRHDRADDELGSTAGHHQNPAQGRRRVAVTLRPEKFHNEEAATRTIQALYRRIAARKMLLQLITRQYRKILDPVSGQPCYYDSVSGTATWFKPAVFGEYDLALVDDSTVSPSGRRQCTLVSPRFSALYSVRKLPRISERVVSSDINEDYSVYGKCHAMKLLRVCSGCGEPVAPEKNCANYRSMRTRKIYDPTTEHFFYYNRKTGRKSRRPMKPSTSYSHSCAVPSHDLNSTAFYVLESVLSGCKVLPAATGTPKQRGGLALIVAALKKTLLPQAVLIHPQ
ncbi:IQ calmodulin binding motif-containing protein [Phytophthora infestans]|uniref:IQ calmodulin binding motif-containing protein n=2 Tax=Phytophthora infestans TaxID=4787 RepID=A0A833WH93_PHYIN|nr:IQ calmodulin binding motif-containing protein [Phytophthora infestans]